jgi:predicted DNA-binding transcriptional regulator AlpA
MPDTLPLTPRPEAPPALDPSARSAIEPLLLPAKQAAVLCGMSAASWHRKVSAGLAPAPLRIGPGCVRWRRSELEDWVRASCPDRRTWVAMQGSKNGKH